MSAPNPSIPHKHLPLAAILFTLLAAAAVYFAGNGRVQLWDRDEPRYAQCSRQMLESGDWVVPRLYDNLRAKKPPLIYWAQAASMKFLGRPGDDDSFAFAARVPSVLAMLATLLVLSIALWRQSGPVQASWTVFIFASSGLAIVAAKICLTDSVLIFFITVAQLCAYAIWRGNRSWTTIVVMAVMFGLGVMIKGPFIFGIVGCTAAALAVFYLVEKWIDRRGARRGASGPLSPVLGGEGWGEGLVLEEHSSPNGPSPQPSPLSTGEREPESHHHGPLAIQSLGYYFNPHVVKVVSRRYGLLAIQALVALLIIVAISLPWFIVVHHRAPEFLPAMFHEARGHAIGGKEGHTFPPGYHLLLVWAMFMPWSLLLPLAIGMGIRHRKIPEVRFALAAVLGPWLMVEFMGTKLPHYFLPAYPALAFLVAFAIGRYRRSEAKDLESRPFRIGAAVWAIAVVAVGAAPWLAGASFRLPWIGMVGGAFTPLPRGAMITLTLTSALLGAVALFLLYARRFMSVFVAMGLGMFAMISLAWTLYFPQADFLRISIHASTVLKEQGAIHPGDVKMVDYKEASLGFYQGGTIREVEKKADLINKPLNQWPQWVVMTREAWNLTPSHFKEAGPRSRFGDFIAQVREQVQPAGKERLRIIDSCRGWAYADQQRVVELLVIRKIRVDLIQKE